MHFKNGITAAVFRALGIDKLLFSKVQTNVLFLKPGMRQTSFLPFSPRRDHLLEAKQKQCKWDLHSVLTVFLNLLLKAICRCRNRGFRAPMSIPPSPFVPSFLPVLTRPGDQDQSWLSSLSLDMWPWTNHTPPLWHSVSSFEKRANSAILASHKIFVKIQTYHGSAIALKHHMLFRC